VAAESGRLDIAAVLTSLYPIVTALLAAVLLRERMGRVQALGIGAAVVAIVLIGAG
jgi:drug/metabolite transporter (DMT)-like permease